MVMIFSSEGIKAGMKKVCTLVAAAFIAAFVYASWQNNDIVLSEYTYESDKIGPEFDGFKIVQVSDLHSKMFGEHSSILLSMIKEQSPDIIVVTGDMVDERHRGLDTTLEFTREAVKIAPVYFVTGNHEELLAPIKREAFISGMTEAGAVFLNNETVYITRGGERISLSGIRDCDLYSGYLWDIVPKNGGMAILLSHRPQLAADYAEAGADLTFCGHAHGGQLRLPFVGGVFAPDQGLFPEYTEGIHYFGESATVISRGLGSSSFPIRLNNRPELVTVTLKSGTVE